MRRKFDMQEVKTKTQVNKAYEEYQEFMKVSGMPKYNFIYSNQKGSTVAEAIYDNNRYNLIVANTLGTVYKAGAKGILIHEFTHIYDEEELTRTYGISHEDRNIQYVYKEVHAEQIKALYLLGCKTFDDLDGINVNSETFLYGKNLYNIHDYLLEYKKEFIQIIDKIEFAKSTNTKIDLVEFNNLLNRIFYYIGTASVYLKYCNPSAFDELDIQPVYDYFGYGLNMLIKVLLEKPIGFHTKEVVEAMAKIRLLIVQHYGKLELIDDTL